MSKILIDENLPHTLGARLGVTAVHARSLGERLTDLELWDYARNNDCVILTKDADFFDRLSLIGAPPKVVWIRTGNMRRVTLEAEIGRHWPHILHLLGQADLVEVHADGLEAIQFK